MNAGALSISKDQLIDAIGIVLITLLSARDCLVRLLSAVPWNSMLLYGFILYVALVVIIKPKRINYRAVVLVIIAYVVILLSILVGTNRQQYYISILFFDFFRFVALWLYFAVFSTISHPEKIKKWMLRIAYFNLCLLVVTTLSGSYSSETRSINYLGLGMGGMIWVSFVIQNTADPKCKHRVIHIVAAVVFSIFIVVYGNRGAVIAIGVFTLFCLLKYTDLKHKALVCSLIAAGVGLFTYYQQMLVNTLINFVEKIGITSRNLTLLLGGNLSYTTHRADDIWVECITYINSKWLTGYGLCYDRVISGDISIYAHNIALEIWLSFGVILGSMLLMLHLCMGVKMLLRSKEDSWLKLFAPFYITSTVVLLFNSSFCILASFWASYGIYFALLKNESDTRWCFKKGSAE